MLEEVARQEQREIDSSPAPSTSGSSVVEAPPRAGQSAEKTANPWTSERIAYWVFVAYLAVALPLLLWIGSYRWFYGDEWSFITNRSVSIDDLFRDHNSHWSTIPVLVYRGLYSVFGLHSYFPYQLLVVVLHLTVAGLLRVAMRRAGVGPWIATAAAGSFVLLGSAEDNILWAFQIGFVGTIALGLGQVMLADHEGPIDRRDRWGLGLGLLALMTSGQGPALVFAAGVVCLCRRRWAAAAFHTVPLAVVYLAWFTVTGVEPIVGIEDYPFTFSIYVDWMIDAGFGLFVGLGRFGLIGVALLILLVGGTIVAWRSDGLRALLNRSAVPVALALSAIVTMSMAAPSRFFLGTEAARAGRYVGVMVALMLPLLAVAAQAVAHRWRPTYPIVLALLVLPIPLNATRFESDSLLTEEFFDNTRTYVSALPEQPMTRQVPSWVRPNESIVGQPEMTAGWLLQAASEGKLPPAGELHPIVSQMLPLSFGIAVVPADAEDSPDDLECTTATEAVGVDPEVGERWVFETPARIAGRAGFAPATLWRDLDASEVEITLPDLELIVVPAADESEFRWCR